jgi:tetratricopeptide (TPR) repeat protein
VPPRADGFVARPESAPGLSEALTPGAAVVLTPTLSARAVVPEGSPDWRASAGKTQLAVYLAESLWASRDIDLLVWVNAANRPSILSAYAAAAAAAIGIDPVSGAEAVSARFLSWLRETSRPWLVVLDDLSAAEDMAGLWPTGPTGRTLVTSAESPAALGRESLRPFAVSGLSRRESLGFLLGRLTEDRGQRTGAIDLVDTLGGEPLALGQASAVLDSSIMSCRDYLDHYAGKRAQLAATAAGRPTGAAVTWTLSVEHSHRLRPAGPVQPMLVLAAVLDGRAIPGTIFTSSAAISYAGGAVEGLARPEDAWTCVGNLKRAGLLTIDETSAPAVVRMNTALQAAVRSSSSKEMLERAALAAADALLDTWPEADDRDWLAESLRSCAASVIRLAGNRLWACTGYQILFRMGESLEHAGLTKLAAAHWVQVAAASEQFLGSEHADSLAANDHLARSFLAAGRAREALPWFRRVLANRAGTLGADHPATIDFEIRMARALLAAGGAEEAVTIFERLVSERAQRLGGGHPETLNAREALADAYCAAGRMREGIRHFHHTFVERERSQGKSDPATLVTGQKLADAYLAADRIKDALSVYKRVAAGREQTLGPEHPATIEIHSRLAMAYQSAGRMATAVQLYERTASDSERVLGVDHPDTLARRTRLAHAYYLVGRVGDAANLLRDTAERCQRVLPPGDPLIRTVRESLVNIAGS